MTTCPRSHQAWVRGFKVADAEGCNAPVSEERRFLYEGILRACKFLSQQHQTRHTGARGQVDQTPYGMLTLGAPAHCTSRARALNLQILSFLQGSRTNPWTYTAQTSGANCRIGLARGYWVFWLWVQGGTSSTSQMEKTI